jgi:organic hydroperoxide reductase OsmC/OhrA
MHTSPINRGGDIPSPGENHEHTRGNVAENLVDFTRAGRWDGVLPTTMVPNSMVPSAIPGVDGGRPPRTARASFARAGPARAAPGLAWRCVPGETAMSDATHHYAAALAWTGNRGQGTSHYDDYGREFRVRIQGKPELSGSADPGFRGDPSRHNPEDLLLVAISSCHMLSYLALCARHRVTVLAYRDDATATMALSPDGSGRFTAALLHPRVVVADAAQVERALALHERAHALCFIANSCNFPIAHEAVVSAADATMAAP